MTRDPLWLLPVPPVTPPGWVRSEEAPINGVTDGGISLSKSGPSWEGGRVTISIINLGGNYRTSVCSDFRWGGVRWQSAAEGSRRSHLEYDVEHATHSVLCGLPGPYGAAWADVLGSPYVGWSAPAIQPTRQHVSAPCSIAAVDGLPTPTGLPGGWVLTPVGAGPRSGGSGYMLEYPVVVGSVSVSRHTSSCGVRVVVLSDFVWNGVGYSAYANLPEGDPRADVVLGVVLTGLPGPIGASWAGVLDQVGVPDAAEVDEAPPACVQMSGGLPTPTYWPFGWSLDYVAPVPTRHGGGYRLFVRGGSPTFVELTRLADGGICVASHNFGYGVTVWKPRHPVPPEERLKNLLRRLSGYGDAWAVLLGPELSRVRIEEGL